LTLTLRRDTQHDIVSMMLTHDSQRLIVVLQITDEHSQIRQYDTENFKVIWTYDIEGHYIKAKEIVQNKFGILYCCPYMDNGVFHLLVFNRFDGILCNLDINEAIGIDDSTRPIDNFPNPLMGAAFTKDNNIFVNLYHSKTAYQYTFTYSFLHKKILKKPVFTSMNPELQRNFPIST
jgi:hypothetical protein